MPDAPCTIPRWFWVITVRAIRATTRTASRSTSFRRSASRASGSAGTLTSLPSAFETILLVTTRTSPERSQGAAPTIAPVRSSPGRNSGSPVTGRISSLGEAWSWVLVNRGSSQFQGGTGHRRGRVHIGHQQGDVADGHARHVRRLAFGDQPAVEHAAVLAGTVVPAHRLR